MTVNMYNSEPVLDQTTAVILFIFTILIHAATMIFLEGVTTKFKLYISAARGNLVNYKTRGDSAVEVIPVAQPATQYLPLYHKLDVSSFS
jgi:hypothetical protein